VARSIETSAADLLRLDAEHTKILIGLRLRGKSLVWYSKTEHMELFVENLLGELKIIFDHRSSRIMLREKFQKRKWEEGESFSDYMHQVILRNRVPVIEEELVEYIIDDIPDRALRNKARVGSLGNRASLMALFEQVELCDKKKETKSGEERFQSRLTRDRSNEGGKSKPKRDRDSEGGKSEQKKRNCFNCGLPDHVNRDCPTKTQGPKYFKCGERGHASKCVKQVRIVSDTNIVARSARKKYVMEVSINNQKIEAFINTKSDICLMRAEQYIRVGAPKLKEKRIRFRRVDSGDNVILNEFDAITIDKNDYPICVHVVSDTLMKHELLIGADFLDTVQITINAGEVVHTVHEL